METSGEEKKNVSVERHNIPKSGKLRLVVVIKDIRPRYKSIRRRPSCIQMVGNFYLNNNNNNNNNNELCTLQENDIVHTIARLAHRNISLAL